MRRAGDPRSGLVRHPASAPGSDSRHAFEAYGVLDTGADAPVMPMWSLRRLGIPLDKKSKRGVYGVSGPFWSYNAKVGLEIECDGRWFNVGTAKVYVPDTPWSRNPHVALPLLLGLNGVFDRIHMCIDHAGRCFGSGFQTMCKRPAASLLLRSEHSNGTRTRPEPCGRIPPTCSCDAGMPGAARRQGAPPSPPAPSGSLFLSNATVDSL